MAITPIYNRVNNGEAAGIGQFKLKMYDLTFKSGDAYATGGFAMKASDVGLKAILGVDMLAITADAAAAASDIFYRFDTSKVMVWGASAELANTTVMTNANYRLLVYGY